MSDENRFDLQEELTDANARLPVDLSETRLPLPVQMRAIALTIAQRHCGDTVVREGNLYQHLKMDNKLSGPLTIDHVIHCALIFERFLWGEWSKGVAENTMTSTLDEMEEALRRELKDEEPTRPHSGSPE